MNDDLAEVWDNAIYKEIASQALYLEARRGTDDPAAIKMLAELASDEVKHADILRKMKESGWQPRDFNTVTLSDLKLSDYLRGPDTLQGAGLQEVLIFAMKREAQSILFYSQFMSVFRLEAAKLLCARLAQEELKHKMKLEMEYQVLLPEREY
jgi:rubrerythrin